MTPRVPRRLHGRPGLGVDPAREDLLDAPGVLRELLRARDAARSLARAADRRRRRHLPAAAGGPCRLADRARPRRPLRPRRPRSLARRRRGAGRAAPAGAAPSAARTGALPLSTRGPGHGRHPGLRPSRRPVRDRSGAPCAGCPTARRRTSSIPDRVDPGLRGRLGLGDRFVVTFAGLHGIAQGLGVVLEAAALLRDRPEIVFCLIGEGPAKAGLVARAGSARSGQRALPARRAAVGDHAVPDRFRCPAGPPPPRSRLRHVHPVQALRLPGLRPPDRAAGERRGAGAARRGRGRHLGDARGRARPGQGRGHAGRAAGGGAPGHGRARARVRARRTTRGRRRAGGCWRSWTSWRSGRREGPLRRRRASELREDRAPPARLRGPALRSARIWPSGWSTPGSTTMRRCRSRSSRSWRSRRRT